ncbi:fibronectin type III domain-containing protein [Candidatus Micrarchaeota archaeon]|nr:fibronectin type III domain-containing protein [Candidatus Micrarchaeota archaeon]
MNSEKFILVLSLLGLVLLFGCIGPSPASNLQAKAVSSGIQLTWDASETANVAGYNVYRSQTSGETGTKLNPALLTTNTYTDETVENGATYYYTVRTVDSSGSEEQNTNQVSATASTSPPSGLSIVINGGDQYTKTALATLSLSASGASECRFSNDGNTWSSWESYKTQKTWTLTSGDGEKTVYYECKNSAGQISNPVNAKITLKTTGPEINLKSPTQSTVLPTHFSIDFTVSDVVGSATCNAVADGSTVPIGAVSEGVEKKVPLILIDGGHSLYLECTDDYGTSKTNTVKFTTEENPVSFTINDGSGITSSQGVTLHIHAPSASQCRYSNNGNTWSSWEIFSPTVSWTLTSGDGEKTVSVECQNADGVSLGTSQDKITLNTLPAPTVYLTINNGEEVTHTREVHLYIYAQYAVKCRFSDNVNPSWSDWEIYREKRWYTLPAGEGQKIVYAECENEKGETTQNSATIMLKQEPDDVPRKLSIIINSGESHTSSREVTLTTSALNADECRYRNENGDWSGWSAYTHKKSWTLSSGGGLKTVYYQCDNEAGNSDVTQASIVLDTEKPKVEILEPEQGEIYSDKVVYLKFKVSDSQAGSLSCTYTCNGEESDGGHVVPDVVNTRTLLAVDIGGLETKCGVPAPGSEFSTSVHCKDEAGNSADSGTVSFMWTQFVGPLK